MGRGTVCVDEGVAPRVRKPEQILVLTSVSLQNEIGLDVSCMRRTIVEQDACAAHHRYVFLKLPRGRQRPGEEAKERDEV